TLARWNGMGLRDPLQIGQALVVYQTPLQSTAVMSPPEERSIVRALVYRVRSGDSLWKIAERFGLRVADILSWNNLDADRVLRPGQRLRLQVNITDH
ncbi:MAG: LysM peptidoglycan-binding domain-containing protein, partial [Pseudomonadales bacterium]|nr:LysM peptidoglycan-binding domain-containing protein [Pseudomonadales bacterium]